jgi:hypothetical protein
MSNLRLTAKEEAFAHLVAKGETYTDAYKKAYSSTSPNAKVAAHKVANRPQVVARIAELRTPDEKRKFLTRARKREILYQIAEDTRATRLERQRSIMIDNRMTGDDRQIVSVEGEITLVSVMAALNGSAPLPGEDEVIDVPSFPAEVSAPTSTAVAIVETQEPSETTVSSEGSPGGQKRTPGPFEEDFEAFTLPEEKPPQKRRTRVYPA